MDRRLVSAVIVAMVAVACGSPTASRGDSVPSTRSSAPSPSAWATPRPTPKPTPVPSPVESTVDGVTVRTLALDARAAPIDVAFAFGSIWIANHHSATVTRMDPATMAVQATIDVGPGPGWFAATDDAVWVSNQMGRGLTRIDEHTNTSGTSAGGWATCGRPIYALGSVWQPACDAHRIMRIDPGTYAAVDIDAAGRFGITLANGRLIVGGPKGLARLDPTTGTFSEIGGPDGMVFAFDAAVRPGSRAPAAWSRSTWRRTRSSARSMSVRSRRSPTPVTRSGRRATDIRRSTGSTP